VGTSAKACQGAGGAAAEDQTPRNPTRGSVANAKPYRFLTAPSQNRGWPGSDRVIPFTNPIERGSLWPLGTIFTFQTAEPCQASIFQDRSSLVTMFESMAIHTR
jgi:hypothetical protein